MYLIEVNTCPALSLRGAVLEDLLPRVLEEVVQKAIDPLFPVPSQRSSPPAADAAAADACAVAAGLQTAGAVPERVSAGEGGVDGGSGACSAGPLERLSGFELLPLASAPRRSLVERSRSLQAPRSNSIGEGPSGACCEISWIRLGMHYAVT